MVILMILFIRLLNKPLHTLKCLYEPVWSLQGYSKLINLIYKFLIISKILFFVKLYLIFLYFYDIINIYSDTTKSFQNYNAVLALFIFIQNQGN